MSDPCWRRIEELLVLSAAGDAYAALADWTTALNYYWQASQAWAKFKDDDLKPYRSEFEKVQKRVH